MPGLPKALIRKYGVSKKAWQIFRSQHKRKGVKRMAKRIRRYRPRFRAKRHARMKVPFEMGIAGIGTLFVPGRDIYRSPMEHIQSGNFQGVGLNYLEGFTGIDADGKFDMNLMATLNPLDFTRARYWKMLFWSAIIGKVRKKVAPRSSQLFKKIPLVSSIFN